MNLPELLLEKAALAKKASREMACASAERKNLFLERLAFLLEENADEILAANAIDLAKAKNEGMDAARLDRLALTPARIEEMRNACHEVASMPDPVGALESQWQRPNGLLVGKMRIPLGLIAMIYEARPNVTIDAAILCVKAGNAILLRCGREARESSRALTRMLKAALSMAKLPENAATLVGEGGHEAVRILAGMNGAIDLLIPRGGEKLIHAVMECARVPVLMHYKGVCHAYIDADADLAMAIKIVENGKTQRPGVCNALEGLLVHKKIAPVFLPRLAQALSPAKTEFRADAAALSMLGPCAIAQKPEDRGQEFHANIIAVNIVENFDQALDEIARYGSGHTEIICTENYSHAMRFLREVDASMVAVNASSRFNDGGQLGLGAEIGISTSKLHAYGPMGVRELTTTKFVVLGNGQIRE